MLISNVLASGNRLLNVLFMSTEVTFHAANDMYIVSHFKGVLNQRNTDDFWRQMELKIYMFLNNNMHKIHLNKNNLTCLC